MVEQRDKEILQIVHSIQDLNEIFKDLATLVVDQVWLIYVLLKTVFCSPRHVSYSFKSTCLENLGCQRIIE